MKSSYLDGSSSSSVSCKDFSFVIFIPNLGLSNSHVYWKIKYSFPRIKVAGEWSGTAAIYIYIYIVIPRFSRVRTSRFQNSRGLPKNENKKNPWTLQDFIDDLTSPSKCFCKEKNSEQRKWISRKLKLKVRKKEIKMLFIFSFYYFVIKWLKGI
jgi:hypothetical protein